MRKIFIFCLILALMMGSALACNTANTGDWMRVVNCEEYISLRAEPSTSAEVVDIIPLDAATVCYLWPFDGKFSKVLYNGQTGYVLDEYIQNQHAVCTGCEKVDLDEEALYNLQIFLTNFSEQGLAWPAGVINTDTMDDAQLTSFAIEHIWYNRQNSLEWGEYFGDNNVRLSDDYIPSVCEKYFGRVPENLGSTHHDVHEGYYYWQETGGHVPCGFSIINDVSNMGNGRYRVNFRVYGMGMQWDHAVYSMNAGTLANYSPEYFNGPVSPYSNTKFHPHGNAIINLNGGSLQDRSTWTLERWVVDWQA